MWYGLNVRTAFLKYTGTWETVSYGLPALHRKIPEHFSRMTGVEPYADIQVICLQVKNVL